MTNNKKKEILNISKDIRSYNGAENIKHILEFFGNPQDKLKTIHIAGTNGKGSTAKFVNNALVENGYRAGMFSSPAVYVPNDRFKVDNVNISDIKLQNYYKKILNIAEKMELKLHEFEIATIIAFLYFYDENCDFAVIEVGIGGRIDATNIIRKPIVSAISSIGKDHMDILGDTIEEIAFEKAGIIKQGSTVIVYNQDKLAMDVIENKAKETNSHIIIPDFEDIKIINYGEKEIDFVYDDVEITIEMVNKVQVYNSVVAFEIIRYLEKIGYKFERKKILKGLKSSKMEGRFQKLSYDPTVIVDGAHNVDSVKALNKTLKELYPNEKFVFIVGFYDDKEYMKLVEIMAPLGYAFITCTPSSERAVESSDIYNLVGLFCDKTSDGKTLENSLDIAIKNYSNKKIVIYGSLSLIKDSIKYFS